MSTPSTLSLWSEDSLLSIGCKGSAVSIGSFAGSHGAVMGEERPDAALLSAAVLAATAVAVGWWALRARGS